MQLLSPFYTAYQKYPPAEGFYSLIALYKL